MGWWCFIIPYRRFRWVTDWERARCGWVQEGVEVDFLADFKGMSVEEVVGFGAFGEISVAANIGGGGCMVEIGAY